MADYQLTKTGAEVDAIHTKVDGIEAGAEVNPTNSEIKTSYESNADTNAFTDAEKSKLSGVEAGAEANDANTTLEGNTFNGTEQLVKTDATGRLPAIDGSQLTGLAGGGDMNSATYDPTNVNGDAFDMDNMVESATLKILTSAERAEIAANTLKTSYPTSDSTKVGFISVTQAVNLDTMESDIAVNNAKISYTDATKVAGIEAGATANSSDATLLARANHTGTQTASTISDFDTEVTNNSSVVANTAKVSFDAASSSKLSGIEAGAEVNTIDSLPGSDGVTGSDQVLSVTSCTQAEYDAGTPVSTHIYIITDA